MRRVAVLLVAIALLGGCDDEPIQVGRGTGGRARPADPVPASDPTEEVDAGPQRPQWRDEDFTEAETNRDPFRNFLVRQRVIEPPPSTREVEMSDVAVEEMRVIAIVTGVADPRAMIVGREGPGRVVRRGNYIGRGEIVQAGGIEELPITLHWRVDRIRPSEVVLTRDDPTAPNRPPLTRVLALRDEAEELRLGPR